METKTNKQNLSHRPAIRSANLPTDKQKLSSSQITPWMVSLLVLKANKASSDLDPGNYPLSSAQHSMSRFSHLSLPFVTHSILLPSLAVSWKCSKDSSGIWRSFPGLILLVLRAADDVASSWNHHLHWQLSQFFPLPLCSHYMLEDLKAPGPSSYSVLPTSTILYTSISLIAIHRLLISHNYISRSRKSNSTNWRSYKWNKHSQSQAQICDLLLC